MDLIYSVNSPEDFLACTKELHNKEDESMISFNDVSLFNFKDLRLANKTIALLTSRNDRSNQRLWDSRIMELINLCLTNHFQYNGQM